MGNLSVFRPHACIYVWTSHPNHNVPTYYVSDALSRAVAATELPSGIKIEDLNWPMKDLVKYAKYVLTRAVENYTDERKSLGLKSHKSRRRFSDYDVHLRVWDLTQQRRSVAAIASLIFPHESREASRQKVRDHLKAAKKLIKGGYAEIS